MLPSQMTPPFDYFKKIVKQLYPTVTHLECDSWSHNVKPIQYHDGIERTEYPPVVSWRIGDKRFKYVLDPKFKNTYHNDIVSLLTGSTIRTKVEYKDQERIVLDLIKWSVEDKSTEEMNMLLDQIRIKNEF